VLDEELVTDAVEVVGGDARAYVPAHLLQRLRGELAGDAHPRDGVGVLDLRSVVRRRRGLVDVLGPGDEGGYVASR
jgi:hypothetical protein